MTWRCLRRVLGRLGGVLERFVASWKCLGAFVDRNYCFTKVKLKILIFAGFSEIRGGVIDRPPKSCPLRGTKERTRKGGTSLEGLKVIA